MKKLMFLFLVVLFSGCGKFSVNEPPQAPYGPSDDTLSVTCIDGTKVLVYTYNCIEGKQILWMFNQTEVNGKWYGLEKVKEGVCDTLSL